jgi:hypothetical protein
MKALMITQDLLPALLTLDNETLGKLVRSAICLVTPDERDEAPAGSDTNPALMFAWTLLRERILLHGQKYETECERRRDHARLAATARHHPAQVPGALPEHARACPSKPRRAIGH